MSYKDERNPLLGNSSPTLRASFTGSISASSSGKKLSKNSPSLSSMSFSQSVNGSRANANRLNNSSHNGNYKNKYYYNNGNTPPHDNNNNTNSKEFSSFDDLMKTPLGSMKLISNEILVTKYIYPTNKSIENMKIFPISINNKIFVIILEYLDINDRMKLLLTRKNLYEWRHYTNIQKKQENSATNESSDTPIIYYQYDTATLLHETFHKYENKKKNTSIKSIKSTTLKNSNTTTTSNNNIDIESILPLNSSINSNGLSYYINIILNNKELLYIFIIGISLLLMIAIVIIIRNFFHIVLPKIMIIVLMALILGGISVVIINIRMFILLNH